MRQLDVFRFWLPLFASWLLMLAEGPLVQAAVNRLPDEVVMLAAFGLVVGLAVLIESPVINLLATATSITTSSGSRLTAAWTSGPSASISSQLANSGSQKRKTSSWRMGGCPAGARPYHLPRRVGALPRLAPRTIGS